MDDKQNDSSKDDEATKEWIEDFFETTEPDFEKPEIHISQRPKDRKSDPMNTPHS